MLGAVLVRIHVLGVSQSVGTQKRREPIHVTKTITLARFTQQMIELGIDSACAASDRRIPDPAEPVAIAQTVPRPHAVRCPRSDIPASTPHPTIPEGTPRPGT